MKLCFLCNHVIALPALEYLVVEKNVVGIGVPSIKNEATAHAHALAEHYGVAFESFDSQQLERGLAEWLTAIEADLVIVFTFPYRIPQTALGIPVHGFYNIHPGPLPAYRGPNPVFWQIVNLEPVGSLTLHRMDASYDTGPVVDSVDVPLTLSDTYNLVVQKMAAAAKERLTELVDHLPGMEGVAQASGDFVHQSRPQREALVVDWNSKSASQIDALIRACNYDYGGAVTGFRGGMLRLLQARTVSDNSDAVHSPGTILSADSDRGLSVQCSDNTVLCLEIIHTESGFFSGSRLVDIAGIQPGEMMTMPGSTIR